MEKNAKNNFGEKGCWKAAGEASVQPPPVRPDREQCSVRAEAELIRTEESAGKMGLKSVWD